MRKILISILIILLVIFLVDVTIKGTNIGKTEVLGVQGLKEQSDTLKNNLENVSALINRDYPQVLSDLDSANKNLQSKKDDYNDLVILSTDNIATSSQYGNYEIEYLWSIIGKHATSEGVDLKMEIQSSSTNSTSEIYDLKFTATGDYVSITNFIGLIENDTSLGFKIEEFKLVPSEDKLVATFACKEISIKIDSSLLSQPVTTTTQSTNSNSSTNSTSNNNTTNNNTTNSTSNNNTTNSTNNNKTNNTSNSTSNNTNSTSSSTANNTSDDTVDYNMEEIY